LDSGWSWFITLSDYPRITQDGMWILVLFVTFIWFMMFECGVNSEFEHVVL
jgi:hypothetical protein